MDQNCWSNQMFRNPFSAVICTPLRPQTYPRTLEKENDAVCTPFADGSFPMPIEGEFDLSVDSMFDWRRNALGW